jgi:hypothetical protein
MFPTTVFFAEGRADEMFVVSDANTQDTNMLNLIKMVKKHGAFKEEGKVKLDIFTQVSWKTFDQVPGNRPVPIPKQLQSTGSLIKDLWRQGFKVHGRLDPRVEASIRGVKGYAGYSYLFPFADAFFYFYFDRESDFCGLNKITSEQIDQRAKRLGRPPGDIPYPITSDELADIKSPRRRK